MHKRVTGNPHLVRDMETRAIMDVDEEAYNNYMRTRAQKQAERDKITHMEQKINTIESDLSTIKSLLTKLLDK